MMRKIIVKQFQSQQIKKLRQGTVASQGINFFITTNTNKFNFRQAKMEECQIQPHDEHATNHAAPVQPFARGYRSGLNTYNVE